MATVTITDGRGRTASNLVYFDVLNYLSPVFTAIAANRCLIDGTLDDEGEYLSLTVGVNVSPVSNKNTASYSLAYKKTSDSQYTNIPLNITGYSVSRTIVFENPLFSVDNTYNIRFQVSDYFTAAKPITQNLVLSSAKPILDIRADGSGAAFGKVAEIPNVFDLGFELRTLAGVLQPELETGSNFNDIKIPNTYTLKNASSAAYLNCPFTTGTGTLTVEVCGEEGQIHQIVSVCSKTNPQVYERFYYQSAWGEWQCTSAFGGKVLWNGGMYMQDTHTINLSEAISKQPTGIELVFSRYDYSKSTVLDDDFSHHFVSKKSVAMHIDKGHSFIMSDAFFRNVGAKYLIITDTAISGYVSNVEIATASGITFDNKKWVLRYVIGV